MILQNPGQLPTNGNKSTRKSNTPISLYFEISFSQFPAPLCLELIKNLNVLIWTRGGDLRTMHKLWWKTWQDLLRSLKICNRIFVDLLVSSSISSMILEDLAKIFQVQVPSLCQDPWGCKSPSGTSKEPKIPTNS